MKMVEMVFRFSSQNGTHIFFYYSFYLHTLSFTHIQLQIHVKPTKREDLILADGKFYECPLYKTLERHDLTCEKRKIINLITFIHLKCDENIAPSHWIVRGCALVSQLND